jgi:hypothetical protein
MDLETRLVLMFIDALDEYDEENNVGLVETFLPLLKRLPSQPISLQ